MSHKKQKKGPKVTRNKERKANRAAQQQDRLRAVIAQEREMQEKQNQVVKSDDGKKYKHVIKTRSVQSRRERALGRMTESLHTHTTKPFLSPVQEVRMKKEVKILKERLNIAA